MNETVEYVTDLPPEAFPEAAVSAGGKPFHGKIVRKWIYKNRARSFDEMTDLSLALRRSMKKRYSLFRLDRADSRQSSDGTTKHAFSLPDNETVETVVLPEQKRLTLCLSSQVGCPMGCRFCASGLLGFDRNLTPGEMVEQVLFAAPPDKKISNIVFMGTGEPLLNLDNVKRAIRIINDPGCLDIGARRITISTIGLPDRIVELADLGLQVNLAVSLHAGDDETRRSILPVSGKTAIADILEAADLYRQKTTRDVTFEYILLSGVNDSQEDAQKLARLLGKRKCTVNLIPWNPVAGIDFQPPSRTAVQAFQKTLESKRIPVTVRRSRGGDIEAACGQLRLLRKAHDKEPHPPHKGSEGFV